jgi:hypothetical protein
MSDLRELLQDIYNRRGELTPQIVVEEGRPPGSPLHEFLPWDDAEAAERYREEVARRLIRSVKVVYKTDPDGAERKVPAFVNLTTASNEGAHGYKPVETVLADPVDRAELLRQCEREWKAFRRKWEHLSEFGDIIDGSYAAAS